MNKKPNGKSGLKFATTIVRVAALALFSMLAVRPVRADYQSTMLSLNPIGYWRFQETNASPPLGLLTNASALGGIANGFLVDSPVLGAPGILGGCVQFTNPYVTNDIGFLGNKIDVPWNAALNPPSPFSIEFWANPTMLSYDSTGYCPLSNFDPNWASGGSRAGWLFYLNNSGRWQFRLGNRTGYAGIITATNGIASPGTWQLIDATWDGTNCSLYVNGALGGAGPVAAANWLNNPQSFIRFGGTPLNGDNAEFSFDSVLSGNGNRGYAGLLEEVVIYSNLLSPSTVSAHYAARTGGVAAYDAQILAANPAGYWPMHDAAFTQPAGGFPTATNLGTLGTQANATIFFGALAGQPGPGYAGFGTNDKSVFFDGDNGYCQISDAPGLHWAQNDGVTTNYISMAAWIKPTEENSYRDIIAHGWDVNVGLYAETFLRISPGVGGTLAGDGNYYEVGASDGVNYYDSVLVPIPPGDVGNWVFLVGTFDGTNWNLYRDGALAGTIPAGYGSSPLGQYNYDDGTPGAIGAYDVTNWWTIGSRGTDSFFVGQETSFGGNIAEPAIFTNALTPANVLSLYNAAEVPPVITQAPQNPGTVYNGATVSFSVRANGNATLAYLWLTNGVSTGVTTTNYAISNLFIGTYTIAVVVSNPYGTNSAAVTFPVTSQVPLITSQPVTQERFVGESFSLSVGAAGSVPLTYYWELGSTVVQSGPSPTYTAVASLANAGSYSVIVSNAGNTPATSAPVAVIVKSLPSSNSYPARVLASAPLAYYPLNETNGSIAYDIVGGNNGVYFGVPGQTTLGVPGYSTLDPGDTAVTFNGDNSYVGNISGTAINFVGTSNSFTLEAWVKAPAGQNDQSTIIAKGVGIDGTPESEQFALDVYENVYRFFTVSGRTGSPAEALALDGPDGYWQYVAGVYDSAAQTLTIYVNGIQEGQTSYTDPINSTASQVTIGSRRTGNDPSYEATFNGSIDQVAIYAYALTANEIVTHFNAFWSPALRPFILTEPVGITNYAGLPVTFLVAAIGTLPLTYQWNSNGVAISGANSATLSIPPLTFGDAASYSVTISNSAGQTNSIAVPLVVLAPPATPPVIPGLVMHLTFDTNLADATGRGNNGTGEHVIIPNIALAPGNKITVAANPDMTGGTVNSFFYYTTDNLQPVAGSALHYSTRAGTNLSGIGFGTNDWFVSLGIRPDLQFGSNDFSVAYWVRTPPGFNGGDLPFFTDTVGSTFGNGYAFAPAYGFGTVSPNPYPAPTNYGGWALSIYGSGVGAGYYGDLDSINDGHWHSLIHVMNHAANLITTYLDGVVAHATRKSGTTLDVSGNININASATIGQDPTGAYGENGSFDIDDLGVWGRAISPLEAGAIYSAAVSNRLSFTTMVTITLYPTNTSRYALSWPAGIAPSGNGLQSSTGPLGPFTNVPGATSPFVFAPTAAQLYYRIAQTNVCVVP